MKRFCLTVLAALGCISPAQAEWRKATSPHFVIYSEGSEKSLRDYIEKVERFDAVLRMVLKTKKSGNAPPLTIYLLPHQAAVEKLVGPNIAGFYHGDVRGSFAVSNRDAVEFGGQIQSQVTLFHEYSHHFMYSGLTGTFPVWYSEGFAEFFSTVKFDKNSRATLGAPAYFRGYDLLITRPVPIEQLLGGTLSEIKGDARGSFYGRAWALAHYLQLSGQRKGQLVEYLTQFQNGKPSLDAARAVFGDLKALDKELTAYISRRMSALTFGQPTLLPEGIRIEALSAEAGSFIMPSLIGSTEPEKESFKSHSANLRQLLAKYPNQTTGWRLLAEAEYANENFAEADKAADAALKLSPGDCRSLLIKGRTQFRILTRKDMVRPEEWKAARSWLIKANRADPEDPFPLYEYYRSFGQQGMTPPEIAFDGLSKAFNLAPEDDGVRTALAEAYADRKEYDIAIMLWGPIAYSPHGGGGASYALAEIERLRKLKVEKKVP